MRVRVSNAAGNTGRCCSTWLFFLVGGCFLCPGGRAGIVDGFFADCNSGTSCVSSQDDSPAHFQEPWEYDTSLAYSDARDRLLSLLSRNYPSCEITRADDRYIRAEFRDGGGGQVDDVEFYFTPNDATVQFRSALRGGGRDGGRNKQRMETLRREMRWTKVPVLRNRRRLFGVVESPWDSFGPSAPRNVDPLESQYK
mmetsp:Transcript_74/g.212  ORF Transcript_74/g.212 Transcript_74/m.212 type:complete len:197 (+) Transcript_74:30-620(+)